MQNAIKSHYYDHSIKAQPECMSSNRTPNKNPKHMHPSPPLPPPPPPNIYAPRL